MLRQQEERESLQYQNGVFQYMMERKKSLASIFKT